MDTMQFNKISAAILVSGISFFMAGRIGDLLVPEKHLDKTAIKIEEPKAAAPAAAPVAPEVPLPVLLSKADPADGQKAFAAAGCVACHSFNDGGKNGIGPNLYGIVGRKIAAGQGYTYSAALSGKGGEWSYEQLNAWIAKPAGFAAGTKMTYAGLADAKKRADIIAWLRTLSPSPVALPVVAAAAAAPVPPAAASAASAPVAASAAPAPAAAPAPEVSFNALLASADVAAGQSSFMKLGCIACHSFAQGGKNGVGPNLYGVVGQPQASHEGYTYSAALQGKKGKWTYDELNAWLAKPAVYAPGTKMSYAGVADAKVRANVIAYLRTLSASPEPLPTP